VSKLRVDRDETGSSLRLYLGNGFGAAEYKFTDLALTHAAVDLIDAKCEVVVQRCASSGNESAPPSVKLPGDVQSLDFESALAERDAARAELAQVQSAAKTDREWSARLIRGLEKQVDTATKCSKCECFKYACRCETTSIWVRGDTSKWHLAGQQSSADDLFVVDLRSRCGIDVFGTGSHIQIHGASKHPPLQPCQACVRWNTYHRSPKCSLCSSMRTVNVEGIPGACIFRLCSDPLFDYRGEHPAFAAGEAASAETAPIIDLSLESKAALRG
jgi:hypothetical protein